MFPQQYCAIHNVNFFPFWCTFTNNLGETKNSKNWINNVIVNNNVNVPPMTPIVGLIH